MTLLVVYVVGALGISFLCSILEAALLSTRVVELASRRDQGERAAEKLLDLKERRVDDAISAILTLNTIAHTIGATLAGAQAAKVFGEAWVGVFSGVLTLLVLVVTEIIPKTLGTVYASRLVGFVAFTLAVLMKGLAPILFVTRGLTRLIAREEAAAVSRLEVKAMVEMAEEAGSIELHERRAVDNLLHLDQILVEDVMTPRTVVEMMPASAPVSELLANRGAEAFSRIPLFEETRDHITGYVHHREVLAAVARGASRDDPLSTYRRDAWYLPEKTRLDKALQDMLERGGPDRHRGRRVRRGERSPLLGGRPGDRARLGDRRRARSRGRHAGRGPGAPQPAPPGAGSRPRHDGADGQRSRGPEPGWLTPGSCSST